VDVGLRRQIYGLEEADIIPAEKVKKGKESQGGFGAAAGLGALAGKSAPTTESAGVDGMGKLDIGWLNSRSGRVGRDMEAELWERARGFLEGSETGESHGTEDKADEDEDMGT